MLLLYCVTCRIINIILFVDIYIIIMMSEAGISCLQRGCIGDKMFFLYIENGLIKQSDQRTKYFHPNLFFQHLNILYNMLTYTNKLVNYIPIEKENVRPFTKALLRFLYSYHGHANNIKDNNRQNLEK